MTASPPSTSQSLDHWAEFRGEPPRTRERWQYIYNAIRTSRGLDDE